MKKRVVSLIIVLILCAVTLCGCKDYLEDRFAEFWNKFPPIKYGFKYKWKQTEDGFSYYVDDEIGLCIMEFPAGQDEITIPEYIDGQLVIQLGAIDPNAMGFDQKNYGLESAAKKLTIQHKISFFSIDFTHLETLTFVDCWYEYANILSRDPNTLTIFTLSLSRSGELIHPNVELVKGNKEIDLSALNIKIIEIRGYVTRIDAGLFDGLENVTIKTSLASKPDGWAENWNGSCAVEWNAEI